MDFVLDLKEKEEQRLGENSGLEPNKCSQGLQLKGDMTEAVVTDKQAEKETVIHQFSHHLDGQSDRVIFLSSPTSSQTHLPTPPLTDLNSTPKTSSNTRSVDPHAPISALPNPVPDNPLDQSEHSNDEPYQDNSRSLNSSDVTLSTIIDPSTRNWDVPKMTQLLPQRFWLPTLHTPIRLCEGEDRLR
ncbi:hypothetical protein RJT34_31054 [Clitoria ternatea]|uniref:Uncharacterized protein n=1 Tax=Clitoria ternatea TaxID=43366 RepID=A0AAN9F1E3_CLITE